MDHLGKLVEQLDLAAEMLISKSPIRARLALILVDNAVELLCHDRCKYSLELKAASWTPDANRLAAEEAQSVLGKNFDPKLKFLKRQGEITEDEELFCRLAHCVRNEAYHVGILHEDLIPSLASTYFRIALDLFVRMRRTHGREPGGNPLPTVLSKHLGSEPLMPGSEETARVLAASLLAGCPEPEPLLPTALSGAAQDRITAIRDGLEYLKNDAFPKDTSLAEIIREVEYTGAFFEPAPFGKWSPLDPAQLADAEARLHFMKTEWKPLVTSEKLDRWEERAREIAHEALPGRALQRYANLIRDDLIGDPSPLSNFLRYMERAVVGFDNWVDSEVKRMREEGR